MDGELPAWSGLVGLVQEGLVSWGVTCDPWTPTHPIALGFLALSDKRFIRSQHASCLHAVPDKNTIDHTAYTDML